MAANKDLSRFLRALFFLVPFFILYTIFTLYPVYQGFYISLHNWTKIKKLEFVGLDNYIQLFTDGLFWNAFGNTTFFVVVFTPLVLILAFILALVCNMASRLSVFYRGVFFLPQVLSVSVVSSLLTLIFSPYVGFLSALLHHWGLLALDKEIFWFGRDVGLSWFFIVLLTLWWTVGFSMLLFLAGLSDIPSSLYEAARIDGAGRFYLLFYVTIPILRPITQIIFLLQVIGAYKLFAQVWLTTRGGPGDSTQPIIQYIYEVGFIQNKMGYASAISYFFTIFLLLLAFIINRRRKDEV